jgi:proline iminopeptidase
MKTTNGSIERSGFKFHYSIEGSGQPVLIIGSRLYYQRLFAPALREKLQLVFIDHRGFTPPPYEVSDPEELYGLDKILEDTEAIRKQLGIGKCWVAGHSGHGLMALEYAKRYDHDVYGVMLISTSPSLSTANRALADLHFDTLAEPERIRLFEQNMQELPEKIAAAPENRFVWFNLAQAPKSWYDSSIDAAAFWDGVYVNMPAIDHLWGTVFRDIDISQNLEDFYTPVWLALGKYDFVSGPAEQWNSVSKHFRDLTTEIFEHSAHNPPYEEASLFNEKLLQWMELYD